MAVGFMCFILFLVCRCSVTADDEPILSKFKYDKHILESMVRMEAKIEQWDKERKAFEEHMLSNFGHRREEMDGLTQSQNTVIELLISDFNNFRDDIEGKISHLMEQKSMCLF